MSRKPDFIMTGGPVDYSDRVRAALGGPLYFDYSEPFFELFRDTENKFRTLLKTKNDIVMMQGEALLGLESVSICGLDQGDVVVNCECGHYGEGNRYFLEKYGAKVIPVEAPWNSVVEPEQVEAALKAHPEAKILWIVHCETPSGTITDLESLARVGRDHGVLVFADAVSSTGSRDVRTDEWGVDLISVGSQKVLGGPVGLSAMAVSEAAWEKFRTVKNPNRHSYVSILDWKEKWIEKGFWPYTPSTTDVAGLHAAVTEYLEVGHEEHFRRYAEVSRITRAGIRAMGLDIWPDKDAHACEVVTAVKIPEGVDDVALRDRLLEKFGILISGSLYGTPIYGKLVRIGHMGRCCSPAYALTLLGALEWVLRDMGRAVKPGSGVAGALEALD